LADGVIFTPSAVLAFGSSRQPQPHRVAVIIWAGPAFLVTSLFRRNPGFKMKTITAGLLIGFGIAAAAAEPPTASISNGRVRATLTLPDVDNGYYRGTRFDWSGSISSLEAAGHSYFGQWFARWDPHVHDSITGPVEDYAPLNYTEAKPGETFVKIGIGVLKKIDEQPYRFSAPYELVDTGKWSIRKGKDFVEYRHEVADPKSGFGYHYTKTIRLTAGKSQMTIEHKLKNTGTRAIATDVYNHGFFMLDAQPTGPDFTVTFPFDIKASREMTGLAEVRGSQIVYLQELPENAAPAAAPVVGTAPGGARGQGGNRRQASTDVAGFNATDPKDFNISIENHKTGAGVRITGDRPLSRINFWSVRTTVCPEAYVEVKADPGKETSWRLTYDFYSLPK
jgi:hypothetical protein